MVMQQYKILSGSKTVVETTNTSSKLVILDVTADDSGCYTLIVQDRHGSVQHQINLTVTDRPQSPAGRPYVSELYSNSVTLSWSGPCYDGGSAILSYVVEMKQAEESDWEILTDSCLSTSFRVQKCLDPEKKYTFQVRAVNVYGISEPSEESDTVTMLTMKDENVEESVEYYQVTLNTKDKFSDFYDQLEKLGVGKFGQVFKLIEKSTGKIYAGKFYKARTSRDKESARQEVQVMNCLHHPRLVQCLAAFEARTEIIMVMEYIAGGELFERIVGDNFEHTEPTSMRYMQQILEGVQYMHQQSILHLDLKPENIMCVNKTGTRIKIIDFGLAQKLDPNTPVKIMHGTPEFVAPEVIGYEPVGFTTDMWSIGVICYILLSGESPFQGNSDTETLANVTTAHWEFDEEMFADISENAKGFISQLLKKDMRYHNDTNGYLYSHPDRHCTLLLTHCAVLCSVV
nr:PREDICTED: myosin light chain kinase, smooth muscle-like [Latimeria chalumnae]|eukprot:XP_005994699.1 PREDICTED: myosin light chain kinase, smooth muscle-like [Latimeria chalumnae]